jgi:predicted secreted protein
VSAATLALQQLADAGLLESEPQLSASSAGLTRRDVTRRIGLAAAILLPAVVSIVAPTPAEAAATCVSDCNGQLPGTPCSSFGPPCTETCSIGCGATCPAGACSDLGGA